MAPIVVLVPYTSPGIKGHESVGYVSFTVVTGIPTYFCDHHSPRQRGSNENTNGSLFQYMRKGLTSLSTVPPIWPDSTKP
jgi:IS30 family transposase